MKAHLPVRNGVFTWAVSGGLVFCLVFFLRAAPPAAPASYAASDDDGEKVFTENCAECHGVKAAGIMAKTKDAEMKGPDLTGIGEKYQTKWMVRYVKLETKNDGKSHKKKFKGSDEELQVLVDWLLEQKAEDYDE